MNFTEISSHKFSGNVLIVGDPATGKTKLSGELALRHPKHTVIHTDDFMDNGYERGLYQILDKIKATEGPTLIEGVQGFRLLRKGLQESSYNPDTVIHMFSTPQLIYKAYNTDYKRLGKDVKYLEGLAKANIKILNDYRLLKTRINNPPAWYNIDNVY